MNFNYNRVNSNINFVSKSSNETNKNDAFNPIKNITDTTTETLKNIKTVTKLDDSVFADGFTAIDYSESTIMKNKVQEIIESSQRFLELIKKSEQEEGIHQTEETVAQGSKSTNGVASAYVLRKF